MVIPETFNQLRLRFYLFRDWISGNPSRFDVGEDVRSFCSCHGDYNEEGSYYSDFVCVFQQTIYDAVSNNVYLKIALTIF